MSNLEGLCVLTPIVPGREAELTRFLEELPDGPRSPLIRVRETHYARWAVVHLERPDGSRVDPAAAPALLLFAAELDGDVRDYVRTLCTRLAHDAHDVWRHCEGCPEPGDPAALARYLLEHRVVPGYSISAYPDATVRDVHAALALKDRLADFVVRTAGLDAEARQRAWLQRFRAGGR